jgi:diguanylate cyclase (GGDEF)-like protein
MGLVIMDIDDFKMINDSYNHNVGDQAMKAFVKLAQETLETTDIMARYMEDEFILILKNKTYEATQKQLLKIKEALESTPIEISYNGQTVLINITGSFGCYYLFSDDPKSPLEALIEADNLLIKAKNRGKNQITTN